MASTANPAAPDMDTHGADPTQAVIDDLDTAPFRAYRKVVFSGPAGWQRIRDDEAEVIRESKQRHLVSDADMRDLHRSFRGSELIATALMLGFSFSYIHSAPDLSMNEDDNVFGEHTEHVQDFVNMCMVTSALLCAFVLVFDVHMLMLLGDLPAAQLKTYERVMGRFTFVSMPIYWLAVVFFGIGMTLLAACSFTAWVGYVGIAVAIAILGIFLPVMMQVTAIARVTTMKYHRARAAVEDGTST